MCACVHACVFYITVPFFTFHLDVLEALNHQLDAEWRELGTFLRVSPAVMDRISKDESTVEDCMLHLIEKWLWHKDGTGSLPRTWEAVVQAVQSVGNRALAQQLVEQHIHYDQGKMLAEAIYIYIEAIDSPTYSMVSAQQMDLSACPYTA